jgi:hypothetical protein
MNQPWLQNFDPLGNRLSRRWRCRTGLHRLFPGSAATPAWRAAISPRGTVALAVFRMPAGWWPAVADGMVFGIFRIAWVVVPPSLPTHFGGSASSRSSNLVGR